MLLQPTAIEGERPLFALASDVLGKPVKLGDLVTCEVRLRAHHSGRLRAVRVRLA
jgi:hypothetical protein